LQPRDDGEERRHKGEEDDGRVIIAPRRK
jgi:hypothetical protein